MPRVSAREFESIACKILQTRGADDAVAADVARSLTITSLRGIDTHGIALLPRILTRAEAGRCNLGRPAQVVADTTDKAVAVLDAGLAPGQHAALFAARLALRKAKRFGIGYVAVRNSTHFGACTPYVLEIVRSGMVALVGSNSTMSMAAFDAPFVNLGNNPIGFGAPAAGRPELVFDFSCGVMSFGRLKALRAQGHEPPAGAFVKPTTRPAGDPVYEIAGSLDLAALPFGGHKGASIAMMIEVLAGIMSGGHFGSETETRKGDIFLGPSHFVVALDPNSTLGLGNTVATSLTRLIDDVTGRDPAVRIPGLQAARCEREREMGGIPLEAALSAEIQCLCEHAALTLNFLEK